MAAYTAQCGHPAARKDTARCWACYTAAKRKDAPPLQQAAGESFAATGDTAEVMRRTHERVRTLADLIRVCEIDTTEWTVERWVANKWEVGAADKDKQVKVTPLYQVKAWLTRRRAVVDARAEIADLFTDAIRRMPKRAAAPTRKATTGILIELAIPDLHLGKLAWSEETGGANYDGKIAEQRFEAAVDALIARSRAFGGDRVLLPIGNDLLHSDTKAGTTTGGTPLDTDSRYQKSFGVARRLWTRAIDRCRAEIGPVQAVMVPGNHDTLAVWHLGDSLSCYFRRDTDVAIDNAPTMRKYVRHGAVMLMFTHGNRGKLADYPLLMATEQPAMFGATVHREAHTGDKHQLRVQEHRGVKVRISPALCPPDAWHAEMTFTGNAESAEAFAWHPVEGLIGTAFYTVPREAAAS